MKNSMLITPLEFDRAQLYCIKYLEDGNTVANTLIIKIDFRSGNFYSLTSKDAHVDKINDFSSGDLLPQHQMKSTKVQKKTYDIREKANSEKELTQYLNLKLTNNKKLTCIFEDVVRTKSDFTTSLSAENAIFFNSEAYYILNANSIDLDKIRKLINQSDAQWYYLNIITSCEVNDFQNDLNQRIINDIVENTQIIVIGAYDMEGYVIWERNPSAKTIID